MKTFIWLWEHEWQIIPIWLNARDKCTCDPCGEPWLLNTFKLKGLCQSWADFQRVFRAYSCMYSWSLYIGEQNFNPKKWGRGTRFEDTTANVGVPSKKRKMDSPWEWASPGWTSHLLWPVLRVFLTLTSHGHDRPCLVNKSFLVIKCQIQFHIHPSKWHFRHAVNHYTDLLRLFRAYSCMYSWSQYIGEQNFNPKKWGRGTRF